MIDVIENRLAGWIVRHEIRRADDTKDSREVPTWVDEPGLMQVFAREDGNGSHFHLRFCDQIAVDIQFEDRVITERPLRPDIPESTRHHFLADQVLPRILGHNGALILHAAAISIGQSAVLVFGKSGSGKSTLAASFTQDGYRILGDDALIVSWHKGIPQATTVYPSLRLFQDSIDALMSDGVATTSVAHYTAKLRVCVPPKDSLESGSLPIAAIFALGASESIAEVTVQRKSFANSCVALIENSFVLDPTDTARAPARLESAARLSNQVPVYDIDYPRTYSRLPEVRAAILEALRELTEVTD